MAESTDQYMSSVCVELCSECQLVSYCGPDCKELDWSIHELECQCFQNSRLKLACFEIRMLLRVVIRWKNQEHNKLMGDDPPWQRTFVDLMSHYKEFRRGGVAFEWSEFYQLVGSCFELPSHETLLEMYGKNIINRFTIPDEYLNAIGSGLYLNTSILNHSCAPNAVVTYNGTEQIIRAITFISKAEPNQIFITYIDKMKPSWERRDLLSRDYFFYCRCALCEKSEHIDRILTSVHCPNYQCPGIVGMTKDSSKNLSLLPCSICGKRDISSKFKDEVGRLWDYTSNQNKELHKLDNTEDYEKQLYLTEKTIEELKESIIHESNLQYVGLLEIAKGACIELELWSKAADYGEKIWPQKLKYVMDNDFTIGLIFMELGKLHLNALRITEAKAAFSKAVDILHVHYEADSKTNEDLLNLQLQCEALDNDFDIVSYADTVLGSLSIRGAVRNSVTTLCNSTFSDDKISVSSAVDISYVVQLINRLRRLAGNLKKSIFKKPT